MLRVEPRLAALRRHLTFVIIAALVPAVLLAMLIVGYDYYSQERDREVRDSLATARAMAASVDAQLKGVEAALFALASSPYLSGEDLAPFHAQARATLADQQFFNIVLLDPALQQKVNTLRPFGEPLPARAAAQQLADVVRTGRPVITDLFAGPVAKEPLIAVGVPVRHEAAVRYVLAAGVTPGRLAEILRHESRAAARRRRGALERRHGRHSHARGHSGGQRLQPLAGVRLDGRHRHPDRVLQQPSALFPRPPVRRRLHHAGRRRRRRRPARTPRHRLIWL
jgi:hypothetical protein